MAVTRLLDVTALPPGILSRIQGYRQITGAVLLGLVAQRGGRLATFDTGMADLLAGGGTRLGRDDSRVNRRVDSADSSLILVGNRDPRVAEQVEPGNGRRAAEERFQPVAVEVVDRRGEQPRALLL